MRSDLWSSPWGLRREEPQPFITVYLDCCCCLYRGPLLSASPVCSPHSSQRSPEHLSQGTSLLCSQPFVAPTALGERAKAILTAHWALHDCLTSPHSPSSWPLTKLQPQRPYHCSCLRAFALAVSPPGMPCSAPLAGLSALFSSDAPFLPDQPVSTPFLFISYL